MCCSACGWVPQGAPSPASTSQAAILVSTEGRRGGQQGVLFQLWGQSPPVWKPPCVSTAGSKCGRHKNARKEGLDSRRRGPRDPQRQTRTVTVCHCLSSLRGCTRLALLFFSSQQHDALMLAKAALTKHHRQGVQTPGIYSLTVLEAGRQAQVLCRRAGFPRGPSPWLADGCLLLCPQLLIS